MVPINYHHLYYFWIVAQSGSIAAAKDRLYLSQPTLSSQLQELEGFCKGKLLSRSRKGVALTPQGRAVFDYCERIFTAGEELVAMLEKGFSGPVILRMGVQTTISKEAIVRILNFARGINRRVRLAVLNDELEDLVARLQRHALDFAVASDDLSVPLGRDFRSRLVCSLPVEFVSSPSVAKSIKRFPSQLSRVPMLLRPPENPLRKQVDQYLGRHRVFPVLEAELEDADLIRRLAIGGRGVAAMNSLAVSPDLKSGRLVKLHKKRTGLKERIWFICSKHPKPNPALREMIESLMDAFNMRAS